MGEGVERKSERDNTCSFLLRNCGKFVVLCLTSETEQSSVHPTHVHALSITKRILLAFIIQLNKVWKDIRQQHWLHVDKVTFRVLDTLLPTHHIICLTTLCSFIPTIQWRMAFSKSISTA
jgi:hypothetical protein